MREFLRDEGRALALWLGVLVAVVTVLTGLSLHNFRADCQHDGGTFTIDGSTAWCRY